MDFSITEEQELLLESLRETYQQNNLDAYLKECDARHEFPEKAVQVMVDQGFHLLGVPEEYGGVGADLITQIMVCEEAARLGFPTFCWPNSTLEIEDILAFGNDEQKKLIIDIAKTGRKSFTLGFTEPQAGSDSSAISTTATRKNGKVYINGHKTFNTSADRAPYMLCMVRDYKNEIPNKDMSMWLVPLSAPGVTIKPLSKIGHWTTNTCEVYLDNVEIEETDLVGIEGKGFLQLMKNFEVERLMSTAGMIGMAQAAYDESVKYAGQRMQFGKTIGIDPVAHKKYLYEFFEGSFPGSFARGERYNYDPVTQDARTCGTTASLCGIEKGLYEGDWNQVGMGIQRDLMMHAAMMTMAGFPMLSSGDEIGQLNGYEYHQDPDRREDSRNLHRSPFNWDNAALRTQTGTVQQRIWDGLRQLENIRCGEPCFGPEAWVTTWDTANRQVLALVRRTEGET